MHFRQGVLILCLRVMIGTNKRSFSGQSSQKPADSPFESGQSFIKILLSSLPHCLHYLRTFAAFTVTLAAFTLVAFNLAAFIIFDLAVLAAFNFANNKIEGSKGEGSKGEGSENNIEGSEDNSEGSKGNSEGSEDNSKSSKNNSEGSEGNSKGSSDSNDISIKNIMKDCPLSEGLSIKFWKTVLKSADKQARYWPEKMLLEPNESQITSHR